MPAKTQTAVSYIREGPTIRFDENGQLVSYFANVNITYQDSRGGTVNVRESFDLWAVATPAQKAAEQSLQDAAKQYLDSQILG